MGIFPLSFCDWCPLPAGEIGACPSSARQVRDTKHREGGNIPSEKREEREEGAGSSTGGQPLFNRATNLPLRRVTVVLNFSEGARNGNIQGTFIVMPEGGNDWALGASQRGATTSSIKLHLYCSTIGSG